jgi:hypothetical protein
MPLTLEELERDLVALRAEVEELKKRESMRAAAKLEAMAGCFSGDEDWKVILDDIERQRRVPDPDLAERRTSR